MSKTKDFLFEIADYVWLIEFAPLTFEERGRARDLLNDFWANKFKGLDDVWDGFNDWYNSAYEMVAENDGEGYATGAMRERLLSWVRG